MSDPGAWVVPAALDGERVDRAVAMLTGLPRARVADAVDAGQIHVAGRPVRARGRRVHTGERLAIDPTLLETAPVEAMRGDDDVEFTVVHEDDDVVVVDKPAGLVVHPGAGHAGGTLVHGLLARYPDLAAMGVEGVDDNRPGIVHRLDRGTSGLLAVARTEAARDALVAQLAARTVERRYVTLVWGTVESDSGIVDAPLGRSHADPTLVAIRHGGRPARTRYHVVSRHTEPVTVTVLQCRLETGRTHQIRVHLASIGHPVVNDERYGRRRRQPGQVWPPLAPGRPFLHAGVLGFVHPRTGADLHFESPLPPDLVATLAPLGDGVDGV